MTNLASGTKDQVQVLVDKGAVALLVNLLTSNHVEVVEQAIWGLGNIAGDNYIMRDYVIQHGAVAPISQLLEKA